MRAHAIEANLTAVAELAVVAAISIRDAYYFSKNRHDLLIGIHD